MIFDEPTTELPFLDQLEHDLKLLGQAGDLMRQILADVKYNGEYRIHHRYLEAGLTRETWSFIVDHKSYIRTEHFKRPKSSMTEITLKNIWQAKVALRCLEALWSELNPYLYTSTEPGCIHPDTWSKVQDFFKFDDSY